MSLYYNVDTQQTYGYLSIITVPSGAKIFIDGEERIETTPAVIELPTGLHVHRLTYPGYVDEEGMAVIEEGKTYDILVTMHKFFDVRDVLIYGFIALSLQESLYIF